MRRGAGVHSPGILPTQEGEGHVGRSEGGIRQEVSNTTLDRGFVWDVTLLDLQWTRGRAEEQTVGGEVRGPRDPGGPGRTTGEVNGPTEQKKKEHRCTDSKRDPRRT